MKRSAVADGHVYFGSKTYAISGLGFMSYMETREYNVDSSVGIMRVYIHMKHCIACTFCFSS